MKEITVSDLNQKINNKEKFQLIDVRETFEYQMSNIGGEHIPLSNIDTELEKISQDQPVIIHCRSGQRSAIAIARLEKLGYTNLYNLKGGIIAWAREIEKSMQIY